MLTQHSRNRKRAMSMRNWLTKLRPHGDDEAVEAVVEKTPHGPNVLAKVKYRWSVRIGSEHGQELATDFEWSRPFGEPALGDVFSLSDGSGPWRVASLTKRDVPDSPGNILIVEGVKG